MACARSWVTLVMLGACSAPAAHRPTPTAVPGPCATAASTRERARTAERQGRLLIARDALAAIPASCRDGSDAALAATVDGALDVADAIRRARAGAPASADHARADQALSLARAVRARLAAGDVGAVEAIEPAYREAGAALEAVFQASPSVAAIVAVAALWREADLRVEANRAADRAVVFVEGVAGTRLVPTVLPVRRGKQPTDPVDGVSGAEAPVSAPEAINLVAWAGRSLLVGQIDGGLRWWRAGHEVATSQGGDPWGDTPLRDDDWLAGLERAGPRAPIGEMARRIVFVGRTRMTRPVTSADGERIARGVDTELVVRSRRDGAVVGRTTFARQVVDVATSATGHVVAVLDFDRGLHVWSPPAAPKRLGAGVGVLAASPDGAQVIAQGPDDGKLHVWSVATGARTATIDPFADAPAAAGLQLGRAVTAIAWTTAGVVVGSRDGDRHAITRLDDHGRTGWRTSVPASVDVIAVAGGVIATGGSDGVARLWNLADGKPRAELAATNPVGASSIFERAAPIAPEWVVVAPDGAIDGSVAGDTLVVWRAGAIAVPGFIAWDRYRRPDLLDGVLPAR